MKKVAIQGSKGCFHHIAALKYFGKDPFEVVECNSFEKLVEELLVDSVDLGIIAIENSMAGSIVSNYNLLSNHHIPIQGEIYIRVEQQLMAFPGTPLSRLHEVFSHPMALRQCTAFLYKYPHLKISEYSDTAEAAYHIIKNKLTYAGAIASKEAAQEYGLEIIAKNIQNISSNWTRFFVIPSPKSTPHIKEFDKASLKFIIPNTTGSLAKLFSIIQQYNINITNIQAVPIIELPWEYAFFVDLQITNLEAYESMKLRLKRDQHEFSILGEYRNTYNL